MPIALSRRPDDVPVRCARGTRHPRAIAWFGFTSFWGHLRHLLATAIATEDIDSRTWMIPDAPADLLARAVEVLSARGAHPAGTLAGALGGEVWVDFLADLGDDVTVSEAVARLLAADYEVADPDDPAKRLVLPRADVLLLGGDLSYPVATVLEMTRRLIEPYNRVLEPSADPTKPRLLLAIPGNHDWYDGLDGFARLCQAPCGFEQRRVHADALHPEPAGNPVLAWAEAFTRDEIVRKPGSMALAGYVPVQRASYLRLPLAKGIELFAVDRQLSRLDPRQQAYFAMPGEAAAKIVVLPDPARAWGEHRTYGVATLSALKLEPARSKLLVLTGDVHHYERSHEGPSTHVVAGGGGAFLHGSRVASRGAVYDRAVEFPGPKASRALLARLPWHVARGGAGWVITALFATGNGLAILQRYRSGTVPLGVAITMAAVIGVGTALLVGWRRHRVLRVVAFAAVLGIFVGVLPVAVGLVIDQIGMRELGMTPMAQALVLLVAWVLSTWTSGFAFGVLLEVIARLGLNHAQPYAALGEPGYKHLVRMRIRERPEGSHVDVFVVGIVDPVRGSEPVLVDTFRWGS